MYRDREDMYREVDNRTRTYSRDRQHIRDADIDRRQREIRDYERSRGKEFVASSDAREAEEERARSLEEERWRRGEGYRRRSTVGSGPPLEAGVVRLVDQPDHTVQMRLPTEASPVIELIQDIYDGNLPSNAVIDEVLLRAKNAFSDYHRESGFGHGSRERKIVDDVIAVLSDLHRFKMEKNSDEKFQRFFFYLKESAIHEAPRATYGADKIRRQTGPLTNDVKRFLADARKALYNMGTSGEFRRLLADLIDFFQIIFSRVTESATRGTQPTVTPAAQTVPSGWRHVPISGEGTEAACPICKELMSGVQLTTSGQYTEENCPICQAELRRRSSSSIPVSGTTPTTVPISTTVPSSATSTWTTAPSTTTTAGTWTSSPTTSGTWTSSPTTSGTWTSSPTTSGTWTTAPTTATTTTSTWTTAPSTTTGTRSGAPYGRRPTVTEAIKEDIMKGNRGLTGTRQVASNMLKNIRTDFTEGRLLGNPEDRKRLAERWIDLMTRCAQTPEFRSALRNLLRLWDHLMRLVSDMTSVSTSATGIQSRRAFEELKLIIQSFTHRPVDTFFDTVIQIRKDMQSDYEVRTVLVEMRRTFEQVLDRPELLQDTFYYNKMEELANRGREIVRSGKYNKQFNVVVDELQYHYRGFVKDKETRRLFDDIRVLMSDLILENGKPSLLALQTAFYTFRSAFIPVILHNVDYIPIPKIEGSTNKFTYAIDHVNFSLKDLVPDRIRFSFDTDTDLLVRELSPEVFRTRFAIYIEDIQTHLRDVWFYFRKFSGFRWEDHGIVDLDIYGMNIFYEFLLVNSLGRWSCYVRDARCNVSRLNINIKQAKHRGIDSLATKLFNGIIKTRMQKAISEQLYGRGNTIASRLAYLLNQAPLLRMGRERAYGREGRSFRRATAPDARYLPDNTGFFGQVKETYMPPPVMGPATRARAPSAPYPATRTAAPYPATGTGAAKKPGLLAGILGLRRGTTTAAPSAYDRDIEYQRRRATYAGREADLRPERYGFFGQRKESYPEPVREYIPEPVAAVSGAERRSTWTEKTREYPKEYPRDYPRDRSGSYVEKEKKRGRLSSLFGKKETAKPVEPGITSVTPTSTAPTPVEMAA